MESKAEAQDESRIKTPWEQATGNQRSRRQERSLAGESGGRAQPNSGRPKGVHNDVRLNGFLLEARTTEKKSYSVQVDEFEKIERNAISTPPGLLPGIQVDFEKSDGRTRRLIVMRYEDHQYREKRIAILERELLEARRGDSKTRDAG